MLIYNFDKVTALTANNRDYTAQTTKEPFDLLPEQQIHSVVLTGQQNVSPTVQLFGDGTFSHRGGQSDLTYFGVSYHEPQSINSYTATAGARGDVSDAIKFELSSNYGSSHTQSQVSLLSSGGELTADSSVGTNVVSANAKLDGTLATLSTGSVLFAAGGQYRRETYSYQDHLSGNNAFADSRNVIAGFVEARVPLVGPYGSKSQAGTLELELADRLERYSDFGNTNNPKVGLIWRALPGLKLRGSYGTSFVAPLLSELNPIPSQVAALPGSLFGVGEPASLVVFGGNPNLEPQKSRNWAFGVDWEPKEMAGLQGYANYYHISYKDRITDAGSLINLFDIFQNERIFGPTIVQRNPSPAYLLSLESSPNFQNFGVSNLGAINAVINSREQNLSSVSTSGIDFGTSYAFSPGLWKSEVGIDGTYILKFNNQITVLSPETSFLNQPYNPIDLKLRARGSIQRDSVSMGLFLNFINSYRNDVSNQAIPVASWVTVDLSARYEFKQHWGASNGASLILAVTNLMDRAPPYVANSSVPGVNYDGVNANALGRFISLQLLERWR
jgi:outer membrane receptor protein involved in Fe transport